MTAATLSLTQSNTMTALRTFLLAILVSGIEVVQAQTNRVPEPEGTDFIVMTPILRERLSTDVTLYSDGYPSNPSVRQDLQATQVTIQLDVHGPNSADNAQIISTLFRSAYAVDQFATYGYDVIPIYANDPHQSPFLNGEQQIEQRWVVDMVMQANPITTVTQDFAATINITVKEVDTTFHP